MASRYVSVASDSYARWMWRVPADQRPELSDDSRLATQVQQKLADDRL